MPDIPLQTGRPGVLVFEAQKESISTFLECARGKDACSLRTARHNIRNSGLRYLNFHHVDTQPYTSGTQHLAESKIGLHEVAGMRELVSALDLIGLKSWFRKQMGMTGDN
jgi:hypothetical protein